MNNERFDDVRQLWVYFQDLFMENQNTRYGELIKQDLVAKILYIIRIMMVG